MHLRNRFIKTLVFWGALTFVLTVFDPSKLPVVAVIVPFGLLFFGVYNLWFLLLYLWLGWRQRSDVPMLAKQTGVTIALFFTIVIILQSIGQLTVRDVLTLITLFAVGYFYLIRMLAKR